jgi:hypothetical protein
MEDEGRPPTISAVPALPSLSVLNEEAGAEIAAQERRADALDSKAGVVLGFAGVLVGLSIDKLDGGWGHVATGVAGVAALVAAAAVVPRSYPTLALRHLRERYLMAEEEFTRRRLLDTRIAMYERSQQTLELKAWLVTGAAWVLATAVVLTVVASIVASGGGRGHEPKQGTVANTSTTGPPTTVRARP